LYFYPLERNSLEEARLVQLASEHVQELARLAGLAGAHDLRKRLSSLTTVWIDEHRDQGPMPQDASDLEIEISETIGDFLVLNEDIQTPWFSCLKEACYSVRPTTTCSGISCQTIIEFASTTAPTTSFGSVAANCSSMMGAISWPPCSGANGGLASGENHAAQSKSPSTKLAGDAASPT